MKSYSKGAKRRGRKGGKRALFQAEKRRELRALAGGRDDPQKTVREARARQTGKSEHDALSAMLGDEAGRAIDAEAGSEASALWQIFLDYDRAVDTYFRRVLGRPRFAQGARMEFMPERLEARPDERVDLRNEDEKHRDAVNDMMAWVGLMGKLPTVQRMRIIRASRQTDCLFRDGRVTARGVAFVGALRLLAAEKDKENR